MSLFGSIVIYAVRNNRPLLARIGIFFGRIFGTDFANTRVEDNNTLWHICPNENIGKILLPVAKANINARNSYWKTALHTAAASGKVSFVKFLTANGIDVAARDIYQNLAIDYATQAPEENRGEILKTLYQLMPDLNMAEATRNLLITLGIVTANATSVSPKSMVPMAIVVAEPEHRLEVVPEQQPASTSTTQFKKVPFQELDPKSVTYTDLDATENGLLLHKCETTEEVKNLVCNGADIYAADYEGRQPIHSLQRRGKRDLVIELIDLVAKTRGVRAVEKLVNGQEALTGDTPLHLAQWGPVVKKLLDNGADPNITNSLGQTPLHVAISLTDHEGNLYLGKDIGIIKDLMSKGARNDIADAAGLTPVGELVIRDAMREVKDQFNIKFPEIVDEILKGTFNSEHKSSPLMRNRVKLPTDVKPGTRRSLTVLHYIALRCNVVTLGLALDATTDIDITDDKGRTPLHYAAASGHVANVQLLLERGADPDFNRAILDAMVSPVQGNREKIIVLIKAARDASGVATTPGFNLTQERGRTATRDMPRTVQRTASGSGSSVYSTRARLHSG